MLDERGEIMLTIVLLMTFLTAFLCIYIIISGTVGKKKLVGRLDQYIQQDPVIPDEEQFAHHGIVKVVLRFGQKIGSLAIFGDYKQYVQTQLHKARIPLKGEEFIAICMISMLVLAIIFTIALENIILGTMLGIVGWFVPSFFVQAKKKKRVKLLNEQLGDAIVMVSNSLKAGYSFFQAVDTVSTEMSGSIAEEFGQVKKEINLGYTTEHALENLIHRVESDDLELMVTAVLIQRQVGGNLAEILDNISGTIRDRIKIKGEVKAITAQGRMSGIIIAIIPPAMGLFLSTINPQHIALLFNNSIGLTMVVVSVIMELLGIYFISKIVNIEV